MTKLLILTFLFSFAQAETTGTNALDGIFKEAILFFTLFGTMSIISYIISRKSAKKYENEHPLQDRKDAARERKLVDMFLNSSYTKIKGKATILLELSQLLEKRTISQEEFKILKHNLCSGSKL